MLKQKEKLKIAHIGLLSRFTFRDYAMRKLLSLLVAVDTQVIPAAHNAEIPASADRIVLCDAVAFANIARI
jgi:hypothetical protein